jgi:DNA repair exonuclease SbcCD ATPase subunit
MAREGVRFRWLEVTGFRGFRDTAHFDLDASAVIISGPNGAGKTSFCDAIQWLLLGSLGRFDALMTRRDPSYVANLYRSGEPAIVRAGLTLGAGRYVEVARTGLTSPGHLEWREEANQTLHGEPAERELRGAFGVPERVDFGGYLLRSAILQQDLVRSVLEDKPADRYRELVALLGLDEIERFLDAVRMRAKTAESAGERARQELRAAEERALSAEARVVELAEGIARRPDVRVARDALHARLEPLRYLDPGMVVERASESVDAALEQAQILGRLVRQLVEDGIALEGRVQQLLPANLSSLEAMRASLDAREEAAVAAQQDASRAADALRSATAKAEALAALASLALPLLGDHCPVCDQTINESEVRLHLRQLAGDPADELGQAREAADVARANVEEAHSLVLSQSRAIDALEAQALEQERLSAERAAWQASEEAVRLRIAGAFGLRPRGANPADTQVLQEVLLELREVWSAMSESALSLQRDSRERDVVEARAQVESAREAAVALRERARAASVQEEEATALLRSTTRACTAVTSRRSSLLSPIVQDIFARLDPHPTLKDLDFRFDVYYEKGAARPLIRDDAAGIEANPILVLSSSQANVAALACFLALGWASGSASAGFLVLDDPLQSMDDVNALGFGDVCRHLRTDRQIIISTHDRRLASLLRRKLAPRVDGQVTKTIDLGSWSEAGPIVEQSSLESEAAVGEARILTGSEAA